MAERDPAEQRLWWLTLARLVGVGLVVTGLWLAGGSGGETPRLLAGLAVMLAGLGWFLLVPRRLLARWRSRP